MNFQNRVEKAKLPCHRGYHRCHRRHPAHSNAGLIFVSNPEYYLILYSVKLFPL